ncbi:ATP-binding protein [Methanolobus bombayensis]|uniref:ATP-binding protein n=1 Tax=Methanolobus bombayensis TaxID=38023 RepID=UPI001AE21421|nr:ATP-binding protein [Methanolobus bombayensis]MBP1907824.1 energy-coupling factor transporter ATP-binding protein EcfA2 [Methanolobus bombayensis]
MSVSLNAGISKQQYILGGNGEDVLLYLGRYLARDRSYGSHVSLDVNKPHALFIAGKRGYGKSYTMAVLMEGLMMLPDEFKNDISSVVIDTMGIFWTLNKSNIPQEEQVIEWGLDVAGFDVDVFVPAGNLISYEKRNISVRPLSLSISRMDGYEWCKLFGIETVSSSGVLLIRIIDELQDKGTFSFEDVLDSVMKDERSDPVAKAAVENYIRTASSWGIFAEKGAGIEELVKRGSTSVIDISTIRSAPVRSALVSSISRSIYHMRLEARRSYERKMMGDNSVEKGIPMVWMFIDEAQQFLPAQGETLASDLLLNEWLKQGRQPGLSLVLATQRPASIHPDVLSQSDLVICHRLTSRDDINVLESVRPTYMKDNFGDSIMKMGSEKGVAFVVDDNTEAAHIIRMRPRLSWHGGDDPSVIQ